MAAALSGSRPSHGPQSFAYLSLFCREARWLTICFRNTSWHGNELLAGDLSLGPNRYRRALHFALERQWAVQSIASGGLRQASLLASVKIL